LLWVGRRGDLVDVAVRAGEVRPVTAIGLVNGTDEVDAGLFEFCARLPDVVDQKTGDRARDEVLVVPVARTEHLDAVSVGKPEDREVRLLMDRVKAQRISKNLTVSSNFRVRVPSHTSPSALMY
jgi:hypothetical protein